MAIDPDPEKVIGLVTREHDHTRRPMQIRVLGPLEASIDDHPVAIGGAKQRAVLAMLGLEANRAVTADRLIEGLWGTSRRPARPRWCRTTSGGCAACWPPRAERRSSRAGARTSCASTASWSTSAASNGWSPRPRGRPRPAGGSEAREALALFRGDPLADVADEPFADPEIRRLEELRLAASELAIDADLAAGHHHELVGEIDALLAENPLRERLHAQRMLALYRCGRQAEALEAFRHARTTLVEEIGVEPSAELRHLHEAILRQDPSLDVEPAAAELPRELDATMSPPVIGRDDELRRLRARWQRAAAGSGALVTLVGAYGMGKTRVAAELAGEAHRDGAVVLYAAGTGAPEAALAVLARARDAVRRTLIVVDESDRASAEVQAALRGLVPALGGVPVLVLASGLQAAALARLEPQESVVLEPLDAGSVRAIAAFYAPADDDGAIPVEMLLATSRGVARRVHEVASEWARREATRRVDAVAGSHGGRSQRDAHAGGRAGRQRRRAAVGARARRPRRPRPRRRQGAVDLPVQGPRDVRRRRCRVLLRARAARRRVGRAPCRRAAVGDRRPVGQRQVVGHAGRAAARARRRRAAWQRELDAGGDPPRRQPLRELRRATRRLSRERHGLLAVDQFEELFTACQDEAERAEFAASLVRAARAGTVVVLAVRADFYGRCAAYPELSQLLGANNVLVGPMTRDELERAIERPAQRVGLSVEPELVESLLGDVEGRPGALPLLSTALLELWRERDGRRLRLAAYARSGGVHSAVARLAEEAFVELGPAEQDAARTLLLRLCDEDQGGAIVRRRIALEELEPARRRSSSGSPTAGCSPSPTAPSRSRTRRSCANGRDCAAGSTKTCTAGACTGR